MQDNEYPLVQHNGQRKFDPPPERRDPPPKGCKLFIGKLPSEIYEEELIALFSRVGKIYETRLVRYFNGVSRGYAFVTFTSKSEALRAVQELNKFEIRPGKNIRVANSVDKCRLCVGGIPANKTKEEVHEELSTKVSGIVDVSLRKNRFSREERELNLGIAFVEFLSHDAAKKARRALVPGHAKLWNQEVTVNWANAELHVDEEQMRGVKVLYVRNFLIQTSTNSIQSVFEGAISKKIEKLKKIKDYAFIHFYEREDAELAMETLQNTEIDGSNIEIQWAKPVHRELYRIQKQNKGNYYDLFELLNKELASAWKADEGIGSAGSPHGYPTINPRGHKLPSSGGIQPCTLAPAKLDFMCKRYWWAQPVYGYEMYIDPRGIEIWVGRIELPQVGRPLLATPIRVGPLMTGYCYSMQQANIKSAEKALRALQMLGSDHLVQESSPPPFQPLYPTIVPPMPNCLGDPYDYDHSAL